MCLSPNRPEPRGDARVDQANRGICKRPSWPGISQKWRGSTDLPRTTFCDAICSGEHGEVMSLPYGMSCVGHGRDNRRRRRDSSSEDMTSHRWCLGSGRLWPIHVLLCCGWFWWVSVLCCLFLFVCVAVLCVVCGVVVVCECVCVFSGCVQALHRTLLRRTPLHRTARNFAFFFPLSRHSFYFFFHSLLVFSWNFGGVFEGRDPQMCTFGVLGLSCETLAAPPRPGHRGSHTTTRELQTCTFELQNTTKIPREDQKRGKKE